MQTSTRKFSASEKRKLKEHVVRTTEDYVWAVLILILFFTAVLGFAGYPTILLFTFIANTFDLPSLKWWSLVAVAILLIVSFLWIRHKWWASPFSLQMKADFENGLALVRTVETTDAILVEEFEDEGQTVFVKTKNGETLVFNSQDLENYTKRGFPWTSFEIVEGPTSGFLIGYHRLGSASPRRHLPGPLPYSEAKAYGLFKRSWAELDVPFEEIVRRRTVDRDSYNS